MAPRCGKELFISELISTYCMQDRGHKEPCKLSAADQYAKDRLAKLPAQAPGMASQEVRLGKDTRR